MYNSFYTQTLPDLDGKVQNGTSIATALLKIQTLIVYNLQKNNLMVTPQFA
jgi:hypothetical protein